MQRWSKQHIHHECLAKERINQDLKVKKLMRNLSIFFCSQMRTFLVSLCLPRDMICGSMSSIKVAPGNKPYPNYWFQNDVSINCCVLPGSLNRKPVCNWINPETVRKQGVASHVAKKIHHVASDFPILHLSSNSQESTAGLLGVHSSVIHWFHKNRLQACSTMDALSGTWECGTDCDIT